MPRSLSYRGLIRPHSQRYCGERPPLRHERPPGRTSRSTSTAGPRRRAVPPRNRARPACRRHRERRDFATRRFRTRFLRDRVVEKRRQRERRPPEPDVARGLHRHAHLRGSRSRLHRSGIQPHLRRGPASPGARIRTCRSSAWSESRASRTSRRRSPRARRPSSIRLTTRPQGRRSSVSVSGSAEPAPSVSARKPRSNAVSSKESWRPGRPPRSHSENEQPSALFATRLLAWSQSSMSFDRFYDCNLPEGGLLLFVWAGTG
jgi:hypothetical protein